MISLDSKVDHLARSQMERLTTITGQINSLQSNFGHNLENLAEQITNLEGRLHRKIAGETNSQVVSSLQRIETKLAANRFRAKMPLFQAQHSRNFCGDLKTSLNVLAQKVDLIYSERNNEVTSDSDFEMDMNGIENEDCQKLFRDSQIFA